VSREPRTTFLSLLATKSTMVIQPTTHGHFETDDGVRLHYVEAAGTVGDPSNGGKTKKKRLLVLLPGWSQSSEIFRYQLGAFAASLGPEGYRVVALDWRGHGESDRPETGYRMGRLARDLDNFLDHILVGRKDDERGGTSTTTAATKPTTAETTAAAKVDVLAHSAACAVVWNYVEIFGQERFRSLVFVGSDGLKEGDQAQPIKPRTYAEVAGCRNAESAFSKLPTTNATSGSTVLTSLKSSK